MPINQYFNYQPLPQGDFSFKAPLEMMGKTLTYLQDKSDKNYAELNTLPSLLNVPVLEKDAQTRANIENKYREKIKQIVDRTGGDYSGVQKDVLALQNDLRKDLSFSGRLGALKSNYDQFGEYQKRLYDNKNLTNYQRMGAINTSLKNYQGAGEVDPVTGKYNHFSGIDIDGFDVGKYLHDIKELKANSKEKMYTYRDGNFVIDESTTKEGVTYEDAFNIAKTDLYSSEAYQQHKRQMAAIGMPIDPREEAMAFDSFAKARMYDKESVDLKRTNSGDREHWENVRHHKKMEKNTEPVAPATPLSFSLPMQQGAGFDLDKKIQLEPSTGNRALDFAGTRIAPLFGAAPQTAQGLMWATKDIFGNLPLNPANAYPTKVKKDFSPIMNFNHPFVKDSKTGIEKQAMDLAASQVWDQWRTTQGKGMKSKSWGELSDSEKNPIMEGMSKDVGYKSVFQSAINNNYASLARLYNNSTYKGIQFGSVAQAKTTSDRIDNGQSFMMTYDASGEATGKTLAKQIAEMTAGKKGVKVEKNLAGFSGAPNTMGLTVAQIVVTDEDGNREERVVNIDDSPERREQWASQLSPWDKRQQRFRYNGAGYERAESGIIYNRDASSAAEYHVAKLVSGPNGKPATLGNDFEGVIFTNNINSISAGDKMAPSRKGGAAGIVMARRNENGLDILTVREGNRNIQYIVKDKQAQMESTAGATPELGDRPSHGFDSGSMTNQ